MLSDNLAEATARQFELEREQYVALAFDAWKRLLDREEPDYAN